MSDDTTPVPTQGTDDETSVPETENPDGGRVRLLQTDTRYGRMTRIVRALLQRHRDTDKRSLDVLRDYTYGRDLTENSLHEVLAAVQHVDGQSHGALVATRLVIGAMVDDDLLTREIANDPIGPRMIEWQRHLRLGERTVQTIRATYIRVLMGDHPIDEVTAKGSEGWKALTKWLAVKAPKVPKPTPTDAQIREGIKAEWVDAWGPTVEQAIAETSAHPDLRPVVAEKMVEAAVSVTRAIEDPAEKRARLKAAIALLQAELDALEPEAPATGLRVKKCSKCGGTDHNARTCKSEPAE